MLGKLGLALLFDVGGAMTDVAEEASPATQL
jgi:hypothetical protein